jgi:hypothetical protein
VCHVKEDKLLEDQWQWKKYGRKSIKGSQHSRFSHIQNSTFTYISIISPLKTMILFLNTHTHTRTNDIFSSDTCMFVNGFNY